MQKDFDVPHVRIAALVIPIIVLAVFLQINAAPPTTKYAPGETLTPNCAPGEMNCTVVPPAKSGVNDDITDLVGITEDITLPGQLGIGIDPGEKLHVQDGNMLFDSVDERAIKIKRSATVGTADNPIFQLGRIISGGINRPVLRFLYSDDLLPERSVFEIEDTGTVASVREEYGSHVEGFIGGESEPLFRLNSYPTMRLELGEGGVTPTDVVLSRAAAGVMAFLTNGVEHMRINQYGNVGVGTESADVRLTVKGGVAFQAEDPFVIDQDDYLLSVGNRSYIRIYSNDPTPANRTFALSPSTLGQILTIEWLGANTGELLDDGTSITGSTAVRLSMDWTPTEYDTLTLISNGAEWIETSRSTN